jgi:hypothetical protein
VWAEIEKGEILLAGEANRNHQGFEDKFRKITEAIEASEGQPNGRSTKLAE